MAVPPRYRASVFVQFFHSRPHWDISFRVVNDTFDLKNEHYLESLGLWGSLPAVLLIFSLVVLLLYLSSYCCRRKTAKKKQFGFLRWVLVFFGVLCCAALGCAMFGSYVTHTSILDFSDHVRRIDQLASLAKNQTEDAAGKLHRDVEPRVMQLRDVLNRQLGDPRIRLAVDDMSRNISTAKSRIASINGKIGNADVSHLPDLLEQVETIRMPVTMGVLGLFVLFCVTLLVGIAWRSRCTLMLFSVLGLLATVLSVLTACALVVIAMGLSDICYKPDDVVLSHFGNHPPRQVVEYFIKCHQMSDNPLEQYVTESARATASIRVSLDMISGIADRFDEDQHRQLGDQFEPNVVKLGQALNSTTWSISRLNSVLRCNEVHGHYSFALESGCNGLMLGVTWMLLAVSCCCVLFYLLVLMDSHLWIYMRKRSYLNTEEADPFLPQTQRSAPTVSSLNRRTNIAMTGSLGPSYRARQYSNTHTPPQTPAFPTMNGRMMDSDPRYSGYQHPAPYRGYMAQHQQQHQQQQHHHHPGAPPSDGPDDDMAYASSFPTLPMAYRR